MAYPVWLTRAGDLGKISSQQYFDLALEAYDPDNNGAIEYSLIAGQLPKGLRIEPTGYVSGNPELIYVLEGVPFSTNIDVSSEFTIRAKNLYDEKITDRTFLITVTGNFPPQITTVADPLGVFLDGTEIDLQLEAIDLNDENLTWNLTSGELPPGLSLDSNGLISGIILPQIYSFSTDIVGWNESTWNNITWEFGARSNNVTYNFTVSVSDTKATVSKSYRIEVYAFNDVRTDSVSITADNTRITADVIPNRPPVLITRDLGVFSRINSGGYYSFKFEAVDYDIEPVTYRLDLSGDYSIPDGLSLDPVTGWLTGYLPFQPETIKEYTFGVYVESSGFSSYINAITSFDGGSTTFDIFKVEENQDGNPIYDSSKTTFFDLAKNTSVTREFTLTTLGNLDLAVDWLTESELGYVSVGSTSYLSVKAVAASGRELTYSLKNGSKLPQGMQLLMDGTISGRVSFQCMGFDRGTTTFDKELAARFIYSNNTKFDNVFHFSVLAHDYANQISAEKDFTLRVNPVTYEPYENLYVRCLPDTSKRRILQQIIGNTDVFDPVDVHRPNDPYFGIQKEIKMLVSYGIKASKLSEYISAMKDRHFNKKFYFGDYKLAQGKDTNGNVLYDVIYVDLIEDTKIYQTMGNTTTAKIPAAFTNMNTTKARWRNPRAAGLLQNQLDSSNIRGTADSSAILDNATWYAFERLNVISPNDLTLMQKDIANNLENSYLNSLPEWMVSVQSDGKILGYTTGAVLAYLKPGTGAKALYNINKFAPFDIKVVPFVSDRYVLNNSYTANFNIDTRRFISKKYTTFDLVDHNASPITTKAIVDFAVDRPFDSLDGKTLSEVISTEGFDGITYNLQDKKVIFATQETYDDWDPGLNDGWNQYQGGVIPGYLEQQAVQTLKNKRGGIWQIDIDGNNLVRLNFVSEILPGDYIYIIEGATHANSLQMYDESLIGVDGKTVPAYTQSYVEVYPTSAATTFDTSATSFINNVDSYTLPMQGDKYLKFPRIGVFTNGQ